MDIKKQPMTAQEVYLHEMMTDFFEARNEIKNSLDESKQIKADISQLFSEVEKSISEMNIQVDESIKKHGDKISTDLSLRSDAVLEIMAVKLNTMLNQITKYQVDSIGKFCTFFDENYKPSIESHANKQFETVKAEIEKEKVKAIKEITVAINRVNGGNLIKPAVIFAVLIGFISAISTSYFTIYLFKENFVTQQPQTPPAAASSNKRK